MCGLALRFHALLPPPVDAADALDEEVTRV